MDDLFSTPQQNQPQKINLDKPNTKVNEDNSGFGYGSTAYNSKPSADYNSGQFGYGATAYNAQQNNANGEFGYGETRTSGNYSNTGYSNNNAYGNSGYGNSGYGNSNSYNNSSYGNSYNASPAFDSSFGTSFTSNAELIDIVKGVVGAIVGAIPGFLIWILLGKVGILATISGAILAIGTVLGFKFMTKDVNIPNKITLAVCILVPVIAIYFANRIVYCSLFTNVMLGEFDKIIGLKYTSEYSDLLSTIKEAGLTDSEFKELWQEIWEEELHVSKITFGTVFSNLGNILKEYGAKGDYTYQLFKSYLFAGLGGFSLLRKTGI